jgi:acetyltransferase-like isoleucine patch superfamily enzyme
VSRVLPHDWYPAAVPDNVVFGEQTWCYSSFAFVHYRSVRECGLRVGHHTGIYAGCQFEVGPAGQVEIGDYCTLVGATIATRERLIIGNYTFIAHDVVLADAFCSVPPTSSQPLPPWAASDTPAISLGDDVWIGARAVLLKGAHLGNGVIVGAGAVVDFAAPPYAVVAGNPGQIVGYARPATAPPPGQSGS